MAKAKYNNYDELIELYSKQNPTIKSPTKLARIIIEEENLDLTVDHFRKRVADIIEKPVEINNINKGERYRVHNGIYFWKSRGGPIKLSVDEADELFYEFSKHGLDMTQMSIRNKHSISIQEWHSIKSTLWLYKDSNIFSPWTVDNTLPEDLENLIASKMDMKFADKKRLVESEYHKVTLRNYNKVIKEGHIKELAVESLIDDLYETLSIPEVKIIRTKKQCGRNHHNDPKEIVAVIADLHIGSRVQDLNVTSEFNFDILRKRMIVAADKINALGADKVHLAILGDLIETFTGLNHKNSWQSIDFGMYGAKVVKTATELLVEFFGWIENLESVIGIGGNHDRMTSDNKEDTKSQVAEIIFYFLQKLYGVTLDIQYNPLVVHRDIDNISYIFTHGDKKVIRDGLEAIIEYGNPNQFNLILQGHWHTRQVKADHPRYKWLSCPSIFSGNYYSESNGWMTQPGLLVCYNDGEDIPVVRDYPLK